MSYQPGILADVPQHARYLTFELALGADPKSALAALGSLIIDDGIVVGLGAQLVRALGARIDGFRPFPTWDGPGFAIPSTPSALWIWLRGKDPGTLMHAGRDVIDALGSDFDLDSVVDGFRYREGRDLSGYVDGTENPTGAGAAATALTAGSGPGLDGGSFVAVQLWQHDLDRFEDMLETERDHVIGRRRSDNEELADAPESAHVKRTAQEDFEPAAFLLRRSMPWADDSGEGLVFVSFGCRLDAFEAQLRRMVGADDGIVDALFRFTRPVTGAAFWCPPRDQDHLDLSALGQE